MKALPSFQFEPTRLAAALAELRRRLPPAVRPDLHRLGGPERLERLLTRLAAVPAPELERWAGRLTGPDLWLLVLALPDLPPGAAPPGAAPPGAAPPGTAPPGGPAGTRGQPPGTLAARAARVIGLRWRPDFGRELWRGLRRQPEHPDLAGLLRAAVERGEGELFPGAAARLEPLREVLAQAPGVARALGVRLSQGREPFARQAAGFDLHSDDALYRAAWEHCLLAGDPATFLREDPAELAATLAGLREEPLVKVTGRYLEAVPEPELAEPVMLALRRRLGLPWEDERPNPRWQAVPAGARAAFHRWWMAREIGRFFRDDNVRHRFWMRYIPRLLGVRPVPRVDALVLFFPGLVAVEFAQIGNAAYLYHRETFRSICPDLRRLQTLRHPGYLKDRRRVLLWVKHDRGWQRRVDAVLRRLLPGEG